MNAIELIKREILFIIETFLNMSIFWQIALGLITVVVALSAYVMLWVFYDLCKAIVKDFKNDKLNKENE